MTKSYWTLRGKDNEEKTIGFVTYNLFSNELISEFSVRILILTHDQRDQGPVGIA